MRINGAIPERIALSIRCPNQIEMASQNVSIPYAPRLIEASPNSGSAGPVRVSSLGSNFTWTLAGNALYAGTQWGILVLLARLGSPKAVGQFGLGLAITAPVMLLASLQLRAVQASDARRQFQFEDYSGLRLLLTLVAICLLAGIGIVFYRGDTALTIVAFAVSKGIESLSDIFYGLWQQQERMDLIAKSLMLRGSLGLIVAGVCYRLSHSVWVAVFGIATAWAVIFIVFDVWRGISLAHQIHQRIWPRISLVRMKALLRLSLPLGIVTMVISFNANVPRYMISHFRGVSELGIFSAISYILVAGTMVVSALGQSATPRLASFFSQGNARDFRRLSNRLFFIGLMLGISGLLAALVFGRQILTLLYGRAYAQNPQLLLWLMIGAATGYMASFGGYSLTAARQFRVQIPLFSLVTILTLGLCFVMVNADGALGAAKALAIVGFIQVAAIFGVLRYKEASMPVAIR